MLAFKYERTLSLWCFERPHFGERRCGSRGATAVNKAINEDVRFRLLRLLEDRPDLSQRQIADELGVSLGATNYVLKALVEKGQIKVRNFRASNNKLRYAYVLTPSGIDAKARLTAGFLKRKYAEYEALKAEIESLQEDLELGADMGPTPSGSSGAKRRE